MNNKIRELLKKAEIELDLHNGEYGTKEKLCLCCESNVFNGQVGIIHHRFCIIQKIREELKKDKISNENADFPTFVVSNNKIYLHYENKMEELDREKHPEAYTFLGMEEIK